MPVRSSLPLFCILILLGCSKGPQRQAVSGSVTLAGIPIAKGTILFSPLAGGPSAGTDIIGGRYELPTERGPGVGKYRVEINAWREQGPSSFDTATGAKDQLLVSIVPTKYNTASELEREIKTGETNTFDFALNGK